MCSICFIVLIDDKTFSMRHYQQQEGGMGFPCIIKDKESLSSACCRCQKDVASLPVRETDL